MRSEISLEYAMWWNEHTHYVTTAYNINFFVEINISLISHENASFSFNNKFEHLLHNYNAQ